MTKKLRIKTFLVLGAVGVGVISVIQSLFGGSLTKDASGGALSYGSLEGVVTPNVAHADFPYSQPYYQGYYQPYYQSYYQDYYQGYYQSYYQGYYQPYYEGYYQDYYQAYYQDSYGDGPGCPGPGGDCN